MTKTKSEAAPANTWGGARNFKDHRDAVAAALSEMERNWSVTTAQIASIWRRDFSVSLSARRVGQILKGHGVEPDSRKRRRQRSFKADCSEPAKADRSGKRRGRKKNGSTMGKLRDAAPEMQAGLSGLNGLNGRQSRRLNAMIDLSLGRTGREVSQFHRVAESTVYLWQRLLVAEGVKGLVHLNYGNSHHRCRLAHAEQVFACRCLHVNPGIGMRKFRGWIEDSLGVAYSISGVSAFVRRMGFRYRNTKPIPRVADGEEQRKFIDKIESLTGEDAGKSAVIYLDGVHPRLHGKTGGVWVPEHETPVIQQAAGRSGLNILGALNTGTGRLHYLCRDRINADAVIGMLKLLREEYSDRKHVHVILDNAPYHHARKITDWIGSLPAKDGSGGRLPEIRLVFQPCYSPNLNRIERLWRLLHKHVTVNKYYGNLAEFTKALLEFLDGVQDRWEDYASYVDAPFHVIRKKDYRTIAGPLEEAMREKENGQLEREIRKYREAA